VPSRSTSTLASTPTASLDPDEILAAAKRAERDGAQRFGIVVAEKGVSKAKRPEEWADVLRAIRLVRDETDVEVDASLGILTEEEARILAEEGINHYNHNIETSPRYFPEIVDSHSFEGPRGDAGSGQARGNGPVCRGHSRHG